MSTSRITKPVSKKIKKQVQKLWHDVKFSASFTGISHFRNALALEKNIVLTRNQICDIFRHDQDFILETRVVPKKFERRQYEVHGYGTIFQADLGEIGMQEIFFGFLLCVDVFSRRIFCKAIETKKAKEVLSAFATIFKEAGLFPNVLETDRGMEFISNKKYFKEHGIYFRTKIGSHKAAFAENRIKEVSVFITQCYFNFLTFE